MKIQYLPFKDGFSGFKVSREIHSVEVTESLNWCFKEEDFTSFGKVSEETDDEDLFATEDSECYKKHKFEIQTVIRRK